MRWEIVAVVALVGMGLAASAWPESGWTVETLPDSWSVAAGNSIALDEYRRPHVVFSGKPLPEAANRALLYGVRGARGWNIEVVEEEPSDFTDYVSLALDQSGSPHVGYTKRLAYELRYATSTSSGWHCETVRNNFMAWQLDIAVDVTRRAHLGYTGRRVDIYEQPFAYHYIHETDGWVTAPAGYGYFSGLAYSLDVYDRSHWLSHSAANPLALLYVGPTGAMDTIASSGTGRLCVDTRGRVHVAYEVNADELMYASPTEGVWQTELVDPSVGAEQWAYLAVAVDQCQHPHIAYRAGSGVRYATLGDAGWQIAEVWAGNAGWVALAVTDAGVPHITFVDRDSQKLVYATLPTVAARVTAQVRLHHDDDPFVTPPPALEGATVDWTNCPCGSVTDKEGLALFPGTAAEGGEFMVRLTGPYYEVARAIDTQAWPIEFRRTVDTFRDTTEVLWPYTDALRGSALQIAFSMNRYLRDYFQHRLGWPWIYGFAFDSPRMGLPAYVYEYNPDLMQVGGASTKLGSVQDMVKPSLRFYRYRGEEADVVFHEIGHAMVLNRFFALRGETDRTFGTNGSAEEFEGSAVDEAIADYFAASFTNDAVICRCSDPYVYPYDAAECSALRDLRTEGQCYPHGGLRKADKYDAAQILSSALWDLREAIDGANASEAPSVDMLVAAAVDTVILRNVQSVTLVDIYEALLAADDAAGTHFRDEIESAFAERNVPPIDSCDWLDAAIAAVDAAGDFIRLSWYAVTGASSYIVRAMRKDYLPGSDNLSEFVAVIATADTLTVLPRDAQSDYVLTVVAVDDAGRPGYMADPVYVEAWDVTGVGELPTDGRGETPRGVPVATPNPSTSTVDVRFHAPDAGMARSAVLDAQGRLVRSLRESSVEGGEFITVRWDGRDDGGRRVPAGRYFVCLTCPRWRQVAVVVLLR